MNTPTSVNMNKSTEHTVFVRFHPPSSILRRHHVEDYFSQIGPIKKASLIIPKQQQQPQDGGSSSSYGFIKYTCESDAVDAASKLNKSTLTVSEQKFQVMVELASTVQQKQLQQPMGSSQSPTTTTTEHQKKHNRVILRNLSFYATSRNVQDALQRQFGTIVDVHIPMVQGNKSRGFAFCTFDKTKDAQKAVDAKELEIKGRKATIQWSVSKRVHQQQQQDALKQQRKQEYQEKVLNQTTTRTQQEQDKDKNDEEDSSSDDSSDSSDSDNDDGSGSDSSSDSDDDDDDDSDSDDDDKSMDDEEDEDRDSKKTADDKQNLLQKPVQEQRQLFVRNLPFDATRHDVFETFRTYGTIEAIYLVTDPTTKLPRGTAFVTYEKAAGAARALRNNKDNPILLKGRPLLMDHAVDKETANTLATARDSNNDSTGTTKKVVGKDKRNFYLRGEGRVDDEEEWAAISDAEKNKRQRAWHDKITKLKSPLFFMNAHRLSIRNISKSVDEAAIKQLLFQATKRGLERKLVSIDDLVAEWTASGEYSAREILEKRKQYQRKDKHVHSGIEALPDQDNCLKVASLDERNIKRSIPSVYLDRDFAAAGGTGTKNAKNAPSRGFAFAEFTHHVQALACLRELNNNTRYTEEYAAGGKAAAGALESQKRSKKKKTEDEAVKLPRIIVEFTVENRAKAKQQAEHRAQQQANRQKQKLQTKEKRAAANSNESGSNSDKDAKRSSSKSRKLGRGAKQREKKRQRKLEGDDKNTKDSAATKKPDKSTRKRKTVEMEQQQQRKPKEIKPPKKLKKGKRKELEAEEKLSKLVKNHHNDDNTSSKDKKTAAATAPRKEALSSGKRWFD